MNFPKSNTFDNAVVTSKIMGPNPLKLCEELMSSANIPAGSTVCDLGSGTGITSCLLASWTPEQLEYMHDMDWWRAMISKTDGAEIVDMRQMEATAEAWATGLPATTSTPKATALPWRQGPCAT